LAKAKKAGLPKFASNVFSFQTCVLARVGFLYHLTQKELRMSYKMPILNSFFLNQRNNARNFRKISTLVFLLILLTVFAGISQANSAKAIKTQVNPKFSETSDTIPPMGWAKGRLLVIPRAGLSAAEFDKAIKPHGVKSKRKLQGLSAHIYDLPDGVDEVKVLNKLKKDRRFKAVELDMLAEPAQTVTDPAFNNSWALSKIQAPSAWQTATGDGLTIAILDTGVDGNHPDLAANMCRAGISIITMTTLVTYMATAPELPALPPLSPIMVLAV